MIDRITIENSIYSWITAVITDAQWIFANQNDPVPNDPFGTIYIAGLNKVGNDIVRQHYNVIGDDFTEFVEGPRELRVEINIFGSGAFNRMSALQASVTQTLYNTIMMGAGLAYIDNSEIRDLTEVISSRWNERSQMDITFYVESSYNTNINRIATSNIDGEIGDNIVTISVTG